MSFPDDHSVEQGHMPQSNTEKKSLPNFDSLAQKTSQSPSETTQDVARSLRLQLLTQVTQSMRKTERKKTALHRNRGIAVLHTMLHIPPIAMCLALVVVNCEARYFGEVSANVLSVFQFATKYVEVFIQASIAAIVLATVQKHVLSASALPFGGLMVPFRITDPSLLWSLELWGCFTSVNLNDFRSVATCLLFVITALLAALVGPSSAVLMIPRPITKPLGTSLWLLAPPDLLTPVTIELNNSQLISEHEYNISSSSFGRNPYSDPSSSELGMLTVTDTLGSRDLLFSGSLYSSSEGTTAMIATVPTAMSVDLLESQFWIDASDEITLRAVQPYVYVDCYSFSNYMRRLSLDDDKYISFGPNKRYLEDSIPIEWLSPNFTAVGNNGSFALMQAIDRQDDGYPSLLTTAVLSHTPSSSSNNSLLLAWAMMDSTTSFPNSISSWSSCAIDASWVVAPSSKQKQKPSTTQLFGSHEQDAGKVFSTLENKKSIVLSPEWAERALSLSGADGFGGAINMLPANVAPAISLALSYVPPIANTTEFSASGETTFYQTLLQKEQYNNIKQLIQKDESYKKYDRIYVPSDGGNWTDPATLTRVESTRLSIGYGYDLSAITVKLSLAVIILYLVIALSYLGTSLTFGITASSWDSMPEVVALALNSERSQAMRNTSAGINTMKTYRQLVNIRVNADQTLGLVFRADGKNEDYSMVESNEKY